MATSCGRNIGAVIMISGYTQLETIVGISMNGATLNISMAGCCQTGDEIKWHRHRKTAAESSDCEI
eukprot:2000100-Karenia_brevis.AAC.1